jgi:hypothetical protein
MLGGADRQNYRHIPVEGRRPCLAIICAHIPVPAIEGDMVFPAMQARQRLAF